MTTFIDETSIAWDYDDLKSKIASWLHRTDLTDEIIDFISLAEDEINTEMRIRLMEVDETVTLASGARTIALPDRYIEPLKLELLHSDGSDDEELHFLSPKQMVINDDAGTACEPDYWTVNGANIEFPNLADQAYTLRFRMLQRFDIANTLTNDLLTHYRGLYLYGALTQASAFMVNDARVGLWKSAYENLKAKVAKKEARNKSMAQLRTEVPGTGYRTNILRG